MWTYKERKTSALFEISGEDVMPTLLGPDQNMVPFQARIDYLDGEFQEITIFGWRISPRTKKPTKQFIFTSYDLDELTREFDPELPPLPPTWVKKLVAEAATFGGKV